MTKELAAYIKRLSGEVSKNIWLDAYLRSNQNGTTVLVMRDIMLENGITQEELNRIFKPEELASKGLIKVLAKGETFIAINLKNKLGPVKLTRAQQKDKLKANTVVVEQNGQVVDNSETTSTNPQNEIIATTGQNNQIIPFSKTVITNEHGYVTSELTSGFKWSNICKNNIIWQYDRFYKNRLMNNAFLAGVPNPKPKGITISGMEVKQLLDIARHFVGIGYNNEIMVVIAFQKMFENWDLLPDYLQKKTSPGGILYHIRAIVTELSELKKQKKAKPTPKDEQFESKITAAKQKDYSHLAKP